MLEFVHPVVELGDIVVTVPDVVSGSAGEDGEEGENGTVHI